MAREIRFFTFFFPTPHNETVIDAKSFSDKVSAYLLDVGDDLESITTLQDLSPDGIVITCTIISEASP
jgi:hypothetical protein